MDKEEKLPKRDIVLLPLLSLLTIGILIGCAELMAHRLYTESAPFLAVCTGPVDPITGARAFPNSVCSDKSFETERVEYRFNSCGHRAGMECGQKAPGAYRIVIAGSSVTMGHSVQQDKTYASLLPANIFRLTGRSVEVYNEGMITVHPHVAALRADELLAAKPDVILWTISPFDIQVELPNPTFANPPQGTGLLATAWFKFKDALQSHSLSDAAAGLSQRMLKKFDESSLGTLLLHTMYESQSVYVKSYLSSGDQAGFLQTEPSADWQTRLRYFDGDVATLAQKAKAAGVPLVVVLIPHGVQAAMISTGTWPAGYDPYKLDNELRTIVLSHGGIYIDILPDYRTIPNPERGYFLVDAHPNVLGHATISKLLAKEITAGVIPALAAPAQSQAGLEQKK